MVLQITTTSLKIVEQSEESTMLFNCTTKLFITSTNAYNLHYTVWQTDNSQKAISITPSLL